MKNIYTARYMCRLCEPVGMPGYYNATLGLQGGNRSSDIVLQGTCSEFVVGKEYLITISSL